MEKKKILVCGAGAVGLYYGGRLAEHGHEVSVVARSDYEVAREKGYSVKSIAGDFHFTPHRVLKDASEYGENADYVFLTSKVLPQVDSSALIRGALRDSDSVIVLIQNGVNIEEPVKRDFPGHELISGIAYIGASRPARGQVLHTGAGRLKIGSYPGGVSDKVRELAALFNAAKVPCETVDDIRYHRWLKLMWNLPYNPVSVLGGNLDTREMTSRDEIESLTVKLMEEVALVASACGVDFAPDEIADNLEFTRNFPPYKTSMLQDFEAGRELEVEAILGEPLRLAKEHKLSTPFIECCYALLKSRNRVKR